MSLYWSWTWPWSWSLVLVLVLVQFVDLCILLGCDYCEKIAGLGPRKALALIQKHRSIENVVQHINRKTHTVPEVWRYQEARRLFLEAPQTAPPGLAWTQPEEEALVQFLCHQKHVIKEHRVRGRMENFHQTLARRRREREEEKASGQSRQTTLDDFFRVTRKKRQLAEAGESVSSKVKKTQPK